MPATINIEPVIKVQPKTEHLWEITHFLNAGEILSVIEFLSGNQSVPSYLHRREFQLPNFSFEPDLASENLSLTGDEFLEILAHGANNGSLESFLKACTVDTLKTIAGEINLASNSRNKEDLVKEFMKKPDAIVKTHLTFDFAKMSCVDLAYLRNDNQQIDLRDGSALFFGALTKTGLLPQSIPQFWRIYSTSPRYLANEPEVEFFTTIATGIDGNACILNLEESGAEEVLKKYIEQHQTDEKEFDIAPIIKKIDDELIEEYSSKEKLFMVRWPNNQKKLANKFGQAKKTKFETLRFGLSLIDRLEPTKKLISAFVDKKIYLSLDSWESPFIGIPIEKNVLEALILHLKLEYLQSTTILCRVQEKITDEILALIWEKTENNRLREASFSATQLTD